MATIPVRGIGKLILCTDITTMNNLRTMNNLVGPSRQKKNQTLSIFMNEHFFLPILRSDAGCE